MTPPDELITVIIPVYNVEDYIDQCLETVVSQTYQELEILLINDGSADGSLARCRAWAERDDRIRVIDQPNRGVAASRNRGIEEAEGTYISFVDPDDWLDLTYFEKLHRCIVDNDADYAECDLWRYDNRTGKKIFRACYGRMGVPYTLREHMKYGPTATYKALSKRSLWIDNDVRMPSCSFESPAVYALILALSRRIANVREPLYYYRRFRENSLIETGYANKDGTPNNTMAIAAMRFLVSEFRRCGLYAEYEQDLEGIVKYRLSDILATQFYRKNADDYRELVKNYRNYLREQFPQGNNRTYLCWGGYNLNRILLHLDMLQDPACRFNFSSLISLLSVPADMRVTHKNRYRKMMIDRELTRSLSRVLQEEQPDYLFLDLVEERFDILEYQGRYITDSDALQGCEEYSTFSTGRRIPFDSEERKLLWLQAFRCLVSMIRSTSPDTRIIVLASQLSRQYGDLEHRETYADIEMIDRVNRILTDYCRAIKDFYSDIPVIEVADLPDYFADKNYEYGAVPSHLNEIVNQKIAGRIGRLL